MDIRTSSKLSHSDNISTKNTYTSRKKTFHYFSLQTSQERNQNARWINALGNTQPKQNAFSKTRLENALTKRVWIGLILLKLKIYC